MTTTNDTHEFGVKHVPAAQWARVVTLGGVPITAVDLDGALGIVDRLIATPGPHYNVAINAAKVVAYQKNALLRTAIDGADLLTADGQPVVWAARLLGRRISGRANGTDMMERLIAVSATRGWAVYFLGAREEVVAECVRKAKAMYPGLKVAGFRNGYFTPEREADVIKGVKSAAPDLLFIGFGTPAKEYFMLRNYKELAVPFMMGVGGSFDVFAGQVRRAPRLMQRCGLEWFFRLLQEPRRMWKRYLVGNAAFLNLVIAELARQLVVGRGEKSDA